MAAAIPTVAKTKQSLPRSRRKKTPPTFTYRVELVPDADRVERGLRLILSRPDPPPR